MINSQSYRLYHLEAGTNQLSFENPNQASNHWRSLIQASTRLLQYFTHLLIWVFLYFFPFLLSLTGNTGIQHIFSTPDNTAYLISFIPLIAFSYINYYWLIPRFNLTKAPAVYFITVAVCMAMIIGLQYFIFPGIQGRPVQLTGPGYFFSKLNYTITLFIISAFLAVSIRLKLCLANAEKETARLQASFLNARVNPHFLFNSLNWIYSLAIEKSSETPNAIIQLSGLMRHILKVSKSDFIDLKKELDYIKNYIALREGRLGNTVSLNTSIPVYRGPLTIAPLLVMSFIENAFKHGVNPGEDSAINIDISVINNRFCLQIINNKVTSLNSTRQKTYSGTGIQNSKQRLNLLYPAAHLLEILDNDKIYSVKLSIILQ